MQPAHGLLERPKKPGGASREALDSTTSKSERGQGTNALYCRQCNQMITDRGQRMSVLGEPQHTFVNPGGQVFQITCFRSAPGIVSVGLPTSQFSWFSGCRWQVGVCQGCRIQLGWSYDGRSTFYGLLLERLAERDSG